MYSISYVEPARKPEPAARTFWPAPARARTPPARTEPEPANFRPEPIPTQFLKGIGTLSKRKRTVASNLKSNQNL